MNYRCWDGLGCEAVTQVASLGVLCLIVSCGVIYLGWFVGIRSGFAV